MCSEVTEAFKIVLLGDVGVGKTGKCAVTLPSIYLYIALLKNCPKVRIDIFTLSFSFTFLPFKLF